MSAAPAMTRSNARKRAAIREPVGAWKTRIAPTIAVTLAAPEMSAITSGAVADLESAGRAVNDHAAGRDPHERADDRGDRALDGDERRQRGPPRVVRAAAGQSDRRRPGCGDRHAVLETTRGLLDGTPIGTSATITVAGAWHRARRVRCSPRPVRPTARVMTDTSEAMLTVGQLVDTGMTVRAVRHYHQRGLLVEPARDASAYRRYGAQAVLDLIRIKVPGRWPSRRRISRRSPASPPAWRPRRSATTTTPLHDHRQPGLFAFSSPRARARPGCSPCRLPGPARSSASSSPSRPSRPRPTSASRPPTSTGTLGAWIGQARSDAGDIAAARRRPRRIGRCGGPHLPNRDGKTGSCGFRRTDDGASDLSILQDFRPRSRAWPARLKIVVSRVRVSVSPLRKAPLAGAFLVQ
jgi:hypothetical protein